MLLAKLGLDVHNRGLLTVAKEFRDAGMEVLYLGNASPAEIVGAAIQERVDVVGVSSLGGAHLTLGSALLDRARDSGICEDTVFVIGGVFPPDDGSRLEALGFEGVFPPGSTREEILSGIRRAMERKKNRTP